MGRFFRLFTDLPIAEIEMLERGDINRAKALLATETTALCHGRDAAETAAETARRVFAEGGIGEDLPVTEVARDALGAEPAIHFFHKSGLAASLGEARRLVRGGGARINDKVVTDEALRLGPDHLRDGVIKLSAGRKRHALVKVV